MDLAIRRNMMVTILAGAGLAATAMACPPDEEGSPSPDRQQLEREVMARAKAASRLAQTRVRVLAPHVAGVTLNPEADDVVVQVDGQGSRLDTKVYKPGEAMKLYGLRMADGAERTLRVKEDGRDIRVEQRNGKVTATINGKEVPSDSVTIKDGKIEVRDESGKVVLSEEWAETRTAVRALQGKWSTPAVPPVPGVPMVPGVTWPGNDEEFPRVMMGITMETADADVVEQLGLPEGSYPVIMTAPDGLPAAKAGLQPKDIIVSIDGKKVEGLEAVRDVIKEKNPGDTIKVEVMRKGARTNADVKLEEFSVKRFAPLGETMGQADRWKEFGEHMKALGEQAQLAIPKHGDPIILTQPDGAGVEKLQERLNDMEAQLKRLEEMLKRLESRGGAPAPAGGVGAAPKPWIASGL